MVAVPCYRIGRAARRPRTARSVRASAPSSTSTPRLFARDHGRRCAASGDLAVLAAQFKRDADERARALRAHRARRRAKALWVHAEELRQAGVDGTRLACPDRGRSPLSPSRSRWRPRRRSRRARRRPAPPDGVSPRDAAPPRAVVARAAEGAQAAADAAADAAAAPAAGARRHRRQRRGSTCSGGALVLARKHVCALGRAARGAARPSCTASSATSSWTSARARCSFSAPTARGAARRRSRRVALS